jgi:lycopene beta-cyclase
MIRSGQFGHSRILLVDREPKLKNDRTWCFWEKEKGFFEDIVFRKWSSFDFIGEQYSATLHIAPYEYKMIRGIDFYNYCNEVIAKQPNVDRVYGEVKDVWSTENEVKLLLDSREISIEPATVFNSIPLPVLQGKPRLKLVQHFKGWVIRTTRPVFNTAKPVLMDFRVHQDHGTTFAYVLPFDEYTALVEYTLFTASLLKPEEYDRELKNYIHTYLDAGEYEVMDEEFGMIPMTDAKFEFYQQGVYQIGTIGGQTKASSGYTFRFIQKQAEKITTCLAGGQSPQRIPPTSRRFRFYDNTLLHILYFQTLPGKKIFTDLFRKNKPQQVLRFLDNESSWKDEWKIISSLPTRPFLKAAMKQI